MVWCDYLKGEWCLKGFSIRGLEVFLSDELMCALVE